MTNTRAQSQSDSSHPTAHRGGLVSMIALAAVVAWLTGQVHSGFLLIFVIPIVAVWLLRSLFLIHHCPELRAMQSAKMVIWIFAIVISCGLQRYYIIQARAAGDSAVRAIANYRQHTGIYPRSLGEAGLSLGKHGGPWFILYSIIDGKPALIYPTTFTVFDTYDYDFAKNEWIYHPD